MFKRFSSIFLVSKMAAPLAQAANFRAVNVTTFDIAGVGCAFAATQHRSLNKALDAQGSLWIF